MKRSTVLFAAVLALGGTLAACRSHEHPKDQEHPEGHEHPEGKAFDLKKEYTAAVERHVSQAVAAEGAFAVRDQALGKEWRLKLVRVHDDRIVSLGDGRYFACADFQDQATGKTVDLDFYATRKGDGWSIEPALLHKVAGSPRFTYDAQNRRVPVKG